MQKAIPNRAEIRRPSQLIFKILESIPKSPVVLRKMTYKGAKKLFARALGGKECEGKRLGVYVRPTGGPKKPWT